MCRMYNIEMQVGSKHGYTATAHSCNVRAFNYPQTLSGSGVH